MNPLKRRTTYQYGTLVPESRKRGPDVWVYRYFEQNNRKRIRRKAILGTLEELPRRADAARASEHLRLAANAEASTESRPTMRSLIDRYIEEILKPCLDVALGGTQEETALMSFQTASSYRSLLNNYVSPRWETYNVSEFERPQLRAAIEQWLRSLLRSARNPVGLAPKTVRHIFTTMKLVFKFAVKWGYVEHNPMAEKRVEMPRGSSKRSKRPVLLTAAQFLYLLPLFSTRERLAVCFAGWLGPRVSEAFGLQWRDLDFARSVVTFRRGLVQGRITPLKTEASRTEMALPEDVLELLREWRSLTPYNQDEDWVFASPYLKGVRPLWADNMLRKNIQPVAIKAGLPKIGWHSFRHTVSAWGKEAGFTLEEVKTLLRHENIATTSEIYGGPQLQAKRELQRRLVAYVKQQAAAEGWKPNEDLWAKCPMVSTSIQ
jgi:integrase